MFYHSIGKKTNIFSFFSFEGFPKQTVEIEIHEMKIISYH